MVSTRRSNKYINKLEIIFLLLVTLVFTSCSENQGEFNLVLKKYSGNEGSGVITFKNLSNNKLITKNIDVDESLNVKLDLDSSYEIEYRGTDSDIFAYIKSITPSDYGVDSVYLALNKNKKFGKITEMNDTIEDNFIYYYLYDNNYIYRAEGNNFKKLSLLQSGTSDINLNFDITDNKVINLDANYLINENKVAFVDTNHNLSTSSHEIPLNFTDTKYIKISIGYYFLITKNNDNNYDCISLKKSNNKVTFTKIDNCIDFTISEDASLLVKSGEFYIWSTDKLYKYNQEKFALVSSITGKSGKAFQNVDKFYLISDLDKKIYLIDLIEETFTLVELSTDLILNNSIQVFRVNDTTTLISSNIWEDTENYYIFNDNGTVTLEEQKFSGINLKNISNIEIDKNQNIFLNNASFDISNQKFNSVRFYNFSYFK